MNVPYDTRRWSGNGRARVKRLIVRSQAQQRTSPAPAFSSLFHLTKNTPTLIAGYTDSSCHQPELAPELVTAVVAELMDEPLVSRLQTLRHMAANSWQTNAWLVTVGVKIQNLRQEKTPCK